MLAFYFRAYTSDAHKPCILAVFRLCLLLSRKLPYNTGKPVKTIVVYSADVEKTITTLDAGSINYSIEAFYMSTIDGDKTYADLKTKVEAGEPLVKQDLMSIVFLPMMKNSTDKFTRFEQAINLSKELPVVDEQAQCFSCLQRNL